MREIKFRAWDKEYKRMGKVMSLDLRAKWNFCTYKHKSEKCETTKELHKVILMQYTGLKDKNDKEIYEGDCITNKLGNIQARAFQIKGTPYWIVRDIRFFFKEIFFEGQNREDIENIGNIYENPELKGA